MHAVVIKAVIAFIGWLYNKCEVMHALEYQPQVFFWSVVVHMFVNVLFRLRIHSYFGSLWCASEVQMYLAEALNVAVVLTCLWTWS